MKTTCVDAAAVGLMMNFPFWSELYYSMKVIETNDPDIPTLATDGSRLWVNPEYWNKLSHDYRITALAHESVHKMLHHCTRGRDFLQPWGNIAADIVVHNLLSKDKRFKIHPDWVQPEPKYDDWTYEAIYRDILPKPKPQQPQPQPGQGGGKGDDGETDDGGQPGDPSDGDESDDQSDKGQGDGGQDDADDGGDDDTQDGSGGGGSQPGKPQPGKGAGKDSDTGSKGVDDPNAQVPKKWQGAWRDIRFQKGTAEEIERFERQVEQTVAKAIASCQSIGSVPAGVEMAMDKVIRYAEEKWYNHLQRYMQSLRSAEYNWARQSKRMAVCHRIVAPDIYSEALGECWVFIDASGSCYTAAVQCGFTMHTNSIIAEAKPQKLHACYFDIGVHKHVEIDPGELELDATPVGGGGTSFVELFEYIEEQGGRPDVVIILTDMYGTFPKEAPPYPVVWASTSGDAVQPPFGELVKITEETM